MDSQPTLLNNRLHKKGIILGITFFTLAAVILAIILIINLIGIHGPFTDTAQAILETIYNDGSDFQITVTDNGTSSTITGWYTINEDEQKVKVSMTTTDAEDRVTNLAFRLVDNVLSMYQSLQYDGGSNNKYSDSKHLDPDQVDVIFNTISNLANGDYGDVDFDEIRNTFDLDDATDTFDKIIDKEDWGDVGKTLLNTLNDNAKDCLGYEKDGDTIIFHIDIYDTLMTCLESIEEYFVNSDDYDRLASLIKVGNRFIQRKDIKLELIKEGKYIRELNLDISKGKDNISYKIEMNNIGTCDKDFDSDVQKALDE